jgi:tRNA modification GTPase
LDTIFALASGVGRAGIAVFRVSGPQAAAALRRLAGEPPPPRHASLRRLRDADGTIIDEGIVLWLPGPGSFTGEDMAELQVHGGRAVQQAVLAGLAACPGLRLAEAGEFTRRAFEHGKLDLTAAEGLADLVNAQTEAQRRQALRQLQGGLGQIYDGWRLRLISLLARLEAHIDFPEDDLPGELADQTLANILKTKREIENHLNDRRRGELLRDGFSIVLLGAPNVGKSSLLNALAGRDAAIVSARAGTTRDVVEVHLDLGGYPVTIADTAGLRATDDEIESEGMRRALALAAVSNLKILLFDITCLPDIDRETAGLADSDSIVVLNKADLASPPDVFGTFERSAIPVSAVTGEGIAGLLERLRAAVAERMDVAAEPLLTRVRHRTALEECRAALERASESRATELMTEDMRLAVRAIGRITGRVDVEDVLDVIFREFCIGK